MRGVTFDIPFDRACFRVAVWRLAGELQQSRASTARPRLGAKSMKEKEKSMIRLEIADALQLTKKIEDELLQPPLSH